MKADFKEPLSSLGVGDKGRIEIYSIFVLIY